MRSKKRLAQPAPSSSPLLLSNHAILPPKNTAELYDDEANRA